jgi:hypothetical protein
MGDQRMNITEWGSPTGKGLHSSRIGEGARQLREQKLADYDWRNRDIRVERSSRPITRPDPLSMPKYSNLSDMGWDPSKLEQIRSAQTAAGVGTEGLVSAEDILGDLYRPTSETDLTPLSRAPINMAGMMEQTGDLAFMPAGTGVYGTTPSNMRFNIPGMDLNQIYDLYLGLAPQGKTARDMYDTGLGMWADKNEAQRKKMTNLAGMEGSPYEYADMAATLRDNNIKLTGDESFGDLERMFMEGYNKGGIARAGFNKGKKVDLSKRRFLKGAGAGLGVLSMLPFVGKFFKPAAKIAKTKILTSVPIESATGMPDWYIPLIHRVLKEGDDVTKKLGTVERELVHTKKIGGGKYGDEEVTVYQNLDTGNVRVEYGPPLLDEQGRVIRASNDSGVLHLEYRAPQVIDEGKHAGKKTNPEFSAAEAEPRVVNWEGDVEWEHLNEVNKVDDLLTDTSPLKTFAKKKLTNKEKVLAKQKQQYKTKLEEDPLEQLDYIERKEGATIDDLLDEGKAVGDFDPRGYDTHNTWKGMNLPEKKVKKAKGGRVSLSKGGLAHILGV